MKNKLLIVVTLSLSLLMTFIPSLVFADENNANNEIVTNQAEMDQTTQEDESEVVSLDAIEENQEEYVNDSIPAAAEGEFGQKTITIKSTNGHTQAEAVAWVNSQVGTRHGNGQCVYFVRDYYAYLGQAQPTGNANQYGNGGQYCPAGWSYVGSPQPGDIAVWASSSPGHVAVVTEIRGNKMVCVESNYAGNLNVSANLHSIDATKYIRPDFATPAPSNPQPIGWLDKVEGKEGALYVRGWAYDPSEPSKQIAVHIYVGGTAGSGAKSYAITANTYRKDVDDAYHCGAYHGFEATIKVSDSGSKNIYAYGIDTQGGTNPELSGCPKTANIKADTQKPTISSVSVSNISSTGFTLTAVVSDNVGVKEVTFPTWTKNDGQDDLIWHKATISGDKATCRINTVDHKHQSGCDYISHIYVSDYAGNSSSANQSSFSSLYVKVPSPISNIVVTNVDSTGYTVTCNVDSGWGATRVEFPSWTIRNGQDDLVWHKGTLSNGKATCRILAKDHGGAHCEEYLTHIYVWDNKGNNNNVSAGGTINHTLVKTEAQAATTTSEGHTEYWTCSMCGKVFKDSNGRSEISKAQTVIPKLGSVLSAQTPTLGVTVKITKPKAAKKAVTVKWKKASKKNLKKISGYQIQVATDPGFTNVVKTAKAGKKASSKKIKGLAKKATYYVRVRAYKGGAVGAWSGVKRTRTK